MAWTSIEDLIEAQDPPPLRMWSRAELEPPQTKRRPPNGRRFVADPCWCSPFKSMDHGGAHSGERKN